MLVRYADLVLEQGARWRKQVAEVAGSRLVKIWLKVEADRLINVPREDIIIFINI